MEKGSGGWQTPRDGSTLAAGRRGISLAADRAVPLRDEKGNIIRWYGTSTDIDERKRAEEALRKRRTELAHVTRVMTLGELTASIAHEVNQPLSAVVTNGNACLRWLAGERPTSTKRAKLPGALSAMGNGRATSSPGFERSCGKPIQRRRGWTLTTPFKTLLRLPRVEATEKQVALRMELAADLPPVLGDRVQLQQVILNLVMNGVEAMASVADRPRELLICSRQHDSDQVLVAVQDSGIGIDRENLEKIFNAFYTTKSQGMGMGLAISRSIIEDHGGRLWAVPNDGPGATFQFTLLQYH